MPKQAKNLKALKRSELQKLAKEHGVKANMKTGDIISALQEVFDANEQAADTENPHRNPASKNSSIEMPAPTSDSEDNLMSVKPPWNDCDLKCFDSTPEQDNINQRRRKAPVEKSSAQDKRRTRSSSRNRTPKINPTDSKKPDGKTFSVKRTKAKARIGTAKLKKNTQKAAKRRPTVIVQEAAQPKRLRRSIPSKDQNVKGESINEELKNEIMAEIRMKIAKSDKKNLNKPSGDDIFTSKIPRFAASGVTIGTSKPITPGNIDWKKLHNKKFQKLESIDDYERRKKERAEKLLGSNQKTIGALSRLAQPSRRAGPKIVKPIARKGRPVPTFSSPAGLRSTSKTPHSIMKGSKTKGKDDNTTKAVTVSVFKPTVTATKNMNLNFAQKSAKASTPKRVTIISDQGGKKQTYVKTPGTGMRNRSVLAPEEKRKSIATPKRLNMSMNTTTPGGTNKPVFDLRKSLKKPLTWVPHKGPLGQYNDATKKTSFQDRIKDIKNPRDKRKQKLAAEKKQAKDKRMMNRRGIK